MMSLSKKEQNEVFECLSEISNIFRNPVPTIAEMSELLARAVKRMYQVISVEKYREWTKTNANYHVPMDLSNSYGRFNPETTYLVNDYIGLLHLVTLLKPMTLIFGEFITRYKDSVGNDHKEQITLPLIADSDIVEMPEYEKLRSFVSATTAKAVGTVNSVIGGIGTTSMANWQMASVIVRRVAPATVDRIGDSVIKKIHGHIDNNTKKISLENRGKSGRGGVRLTERSLKSRSNADEQISVIDSHRLKQLYPTHIPIVAQTYTLKPVETEESHYEFDFPDDLRDLIKTFDGEYPDDYPVPTAEDLKGLAAIEIYDHHLQIISMLTKKKIPPKVMINMDYKSIVSLLIATQCIIHRWGFTDLAQFLTATTEKITDTMLVDVAVLKITTDQQKQLATIYRHYSPKNRRQVTLKRVALNLGIELIDSTLGTITKLQHHYNSVPMLKHKIVNGRYMKIPKTIGREFADLLIHVAAHTAKK